MACLGGIAANIRSKNAGPFCVTLDVFFKSREDFRAYADHLSSEVVADLCKIDPAQINRFELPALKAVKFSFPRSGLQGARLDRDMHGAQLAVLIKEADLN